MGPPDESIRWPARFDPARAPVHVRNRIDIDGTSPATVWAWLVRAPLWPTYYPNSANVVLENGATHLSPGARFRWRTFGVPLRSVVEEFVPCERIAWRAQTFGVDAYHAWLIRPLPDGGSRVLTEESQYGWLARLGNLFMPRRMYRGHQLWLERLAAQARRGPPPGEPPCA